MSVPPITSVSSTAEPVLHISRLFRVRVARKGMPAYSYTARSRHSFDAWSAAMDRAIDVCNTSPVSITIEPKGRSTTAPSYNFGGNNVS